jgi:hypothetical protein
VSLNGRTPADYDDAVTLAGRTPADFDDAETLDGVTRFDIQTSTGHSSSLNNIAITGTTPATATTVYGFGGGFDVYVVVSMIVDTSYDSGLFSCLVDGEPIPGITDIKVGDAAVGYADRVSVTGQYALGAGGAVQVKCFHESAVGSGSVQVTEWSRTYFEAT